MKVAGSFRLLSLFQVTLSCYLWTVTRSSPELNSKNYYTCGVDVCEEGIQFCNTIDRRCEYCADYNQDCFRYVQQQNCTQYCQDQWRLNQSENCSSCEPKTCEDVYKILFVISSILWLITFIILILRVKRIQTTLMSVISLFLPPQIIRVVWQLFNKNAIARQNDQERNSQTAGSGRTSTEDVENVQGEEKTEEMEIQRLTKTLSSTKGDTSRKALFETTASLNKSAQDGKENNSSAAQQEPQENFDISQSQPEHKATGSIISLPGNIVRGSRETSGTTTLTGAYTSPEIGEINREESDQTNEDTELLKAGSKLPQVTPSDGDLYTSIDPRGELSTMSSRGGYQALLPNSNQSTDNGYVTAIANRCTNS